MRLGYGVDQIDAGGVVVGGARISSKTVIWTAGVAPSPAGKWLNVPTDRPGRVRIQPDLSVPGIRKFSWSEIQPRSIRIGSRFRAWRRSLCSKGITPAT